MAHLSESSYLAVHGATRQPANVPLHNTSHSHKVTPLCLNMLLAETDTAQHEWNIFLFCYSTSLIFMTSMKLDNYTKNTLLL